MNALDRPLTPTEAASAARRRAFHQSIPAGNRRLRLRSAHRPCSPAEVVADPGGDCGGVRPARGLCEVDRPPSADREAKAGDHCRPDCERFGQGRCSELVGQLQNTQADRGVKSREAGPEPGMPPNCRQSANWRRTVESSIRGWLDDVSGLRREMKEAAN